jgi:hypothetical protein
LRYVINTEHHWDHIGGNCFYPDARVISHSKTREGAIEGFAAFEFWYNRMQTLDPEGLDLLKDYEVRLSDLTYDEALTLNRGIPRVRPSSTCPRSRRSFPATTFFGIGHPCWNPASAVHGWPVLILSKPWM